MKTVQMESYTPTRRKYRLKLAQSTSEATRVSVIIRPSGDAVQNDASRGNHTLPYLLSHLQPYHSLLNAPSVL